jgi:anti-anti-sigma factor
MIAHDARRVDPEKTLQKSIGKDILCCVANRNLFLFFKQRSRRMGLKIETTKHGSIPAIKLVGRVIGIDDRKLSKKMESFYKKNPGKLIVDVSEADFIDSHGIGIIVYYHTLMQKSNATLIVLNSNPNPVAYMTRLFEMTNLDKVLNVVASIEETQ